MTALRAHPAVEYEPVTYAAWSYIMTEDDLPSLGPNGHGTIIDDAKGKRAEIRKPYRAVIHLDTLLCQGCDQPIRAHCCDNCEVVFIDTPPGAEGIQL